MSAEPRWLSKQALLFLHAESLAAFGGAAGLRDEGLLESALARPLNLFAYEGVTDIGRLAASYAAGIARNHPFVDGNKRAAFAAAGVFLKLNGFDLTADQAVATAAMLDLAAGDLPEDGFAAWLRDNLRPRG
ncbi:type II toxin-antitoxin system death-on-curing family toxin [Siccirubricoccus sp. G192]|uniref:type II toxin-antitoxin system death-on-curing family toxin n=1 Tax=Siccirubricoccus sp. G192 TaxID=2849651 RepID=UPI001C2B9870|nr:type II toxin-antitoxin system death-on-curing family toxin [Siccirubricoccus sp. G192]MBV1796972.1 type II toxin-antitoxin system death-on-curing family toxin [Siccirubricoccus sp. G192]